jgi:hypothetical protein
MLSVIDTPPSKRHIEKKRLTIWEKVWRVYVAE